MDPMKTSASVREREEGLALIAFLLMVSIGAVIIAGSLTLASNDLRTNSSATTRSRNFFDVESTLGDSISWFRSHGGDLVTPFKRDNFYASFDRSSPGVGSNDSSLFTIPTRVKLKGSSSSALFVSNNQLGSSSFPTTLTAGGSSFAAGTSFTGASNTGLLYRATLVDAIAVDPSKDYGPPPAAPPETDFYPVYRLDVMSALDRGAHIYGYLIGSMTYTDTVGFYGRDYVQAMQECDSYISSDGAYGGANKRAHCPVGSNGEVRVHQNEEIYGSVRTNGDIVETTPFGGKICSDFATNCPNKGSTCEGATCAVPGLPTMSPWTTYCPTDQGDRTISANSTYTVAGNNANQKCWNTVHINSNRTLTLTSTNYPYFIKTLSFQNSSNARLNIAPNPPTGIVTLFVESFSGGTVNGNNRPSQFKIYYLGSSPLTLNGTAAMSAAIVAPNGGVNVQGNFEFKGGIMATFLNWTGSGKVHYDESLGGTVLTGQTFRLRGMIQYYR